MSVADNIRGLKPVRTGTSGPAISYVAGGRIAFGAAVMRSGAGTVMGTPTPDVNSVIGFAEGDVYEHTYAGFYESGEPVSVITSGNVNALVAGTSSLVAGDFLETVDVGSSNANPIGVLEEAGSATGETRTTSSVAMLLEDVAFGSNSSKLLASAASSGDTSITLVSGGVSAMGLKRGDFVLLVTVSSTTSLPTAGQLNRIKAVSDDTLTLEIPLAFDMDTTDDKVMVVKQALVKIL